MSDIITASVYNDPQLATLRSQVAAKNDNVPYLLLPVKIETRFMKVDRPIVVKNPFPGVLENLFQVEDYMTFQPSATPPHEVLGKVKNLSGKLQAIEESAAEIQSISLKDKETLTRQMNVLRKQHTALTGQLSRWSAADETGLKQLRSHRNDADAAITRLARTIEGLQTAATAEVSATGSFLGSLENIAGVMDKMATRDLSTGDRKEKRKVFAFLDEQIAHIDAGLKELRMNMAVNMTPTATQLKQVDELTGKFQTLTARVARNLTRLRSKYKIVEYNERLAGLTKKYEELHSEIQNRVKPKMQMMHELRKTDARDVLNLIFEVRSYLKKQNKHSFTTYEEIRSVRKNLYGMLHALREEVHKVIEGSDEEITGINKAWDETDSELEKFTRRVEAFKTPDSEERAGLSRTVTHINKEYRRDLEGLKSTSKSAFPRLNNTTLEKSAIAYHEALNRLRTLNDQLSRRAQGIESVAKELDDFRKSFSIASRDIHILPQKAYDELKKASLQLEEQVKKLVERKPADRASRGIPDITAGLTDAAKTITETVTAQHTDSLDRKDRFYDEVRSPLVFATKTVTRDELWVRFYPDDIAIHTHEEALTQEEIDSGKGYWYEILAAGEDQDLKLAAWRAITTSYGPQRAAWIVRTMQPRDTDNTAMRDTLLGASKPLTDANDYLARINTILNQLNGKANIAQVLGQAYPLLQTVHEKLQGITKDNKTLLLKTQKQLLKAQSAINKGVGIVKQMSDQEKRTSASSIQTLQEFIKGFNNIVNKYQTIGKVSSREIIRGLSASPVFPEVQVKEGSWTETPHSRVMPGRFAVITVRNGVYRHIKLSNPLPPEKLIVGLDPSTFSTETFAYDADGNLIVDENIKWLTDFDEAQKKGMAVAITLNAEDVAQGFDKVFVLGVKDTTPSDGKKLLEDLIDNHHYITEGASFLPVGTPTNNTEAGTSGYRKFEDDASLSFEVERNNELPVTTIPDPAFPTDAERLAEGLGIDVSVLTNLDYSSRTEISEVLTLNKALFPGTLGNHMEEGLDMLFTLDNINHTKAFFTEYVSSRGFLPSIRVGTQPYGILPTTAFSKFSVTADDSIVPVLTKDDFDKHYNTIQDELKVRFDIRLKQLLSLLDSLWTSIRINKVPYSGNTDPSDPQAHFMKMLGLQASSAEFFYRYGLNIAARQGSGEISLNFNSDDSWSPTQVAETFRDQIFSGYFYKSDSFYDEQNTFGNVIDYLNYKNSRISTQFSTARVFSMRHVQDQSQILGDFIDDRELSDAIVTPDNANSGTAEEMLKARAELQYFIDWLVNGDPFDIQAQNTFSEVSDTGLTAGMPSKSLLFLLLRHSMLTSYADAILKILEFEGLTDQKTRKKMGSQKNYYQRFSGSFTYVTKWTYLFSKINKLNGVLGFDMNQANGFYAYMNSLSGSSNGFLDRYLSPKHINIFNNYPNHNLHQPFVDELNATREAIRKLKDIPTLRLQQLLAEHIDLCTYRLDAWRLGLVNRRLKEQRTVGASGIYLGAYGWVENLRKGGEMQPAPSIPSGLWKNGDGPIFTDADNLGFVHTPSLNHAITAAILRAGFHANEATAETENQMAVNLSSERVRTALNLINGIRSGQSAASLLGYQFERGLHERYLHIPLELDQYIYDFRKEFPLAVPVDSSLSLGDARINQVVDGMELLETAQQFVDAQGGPPNPGDNLYQSLKAYEAAWWTSIGNANLSGASAAEKDAMLKEIDRIADAFDALGDLCISESVYQVAKGNHVRSSGIMDKLAKGDVPNDIEIADTPRTGTVVTHKVGLFFDPVSGIDHALTGSGADSVPLSGTELALAVTAAGAAAPGWTCPFTPRALAEPAINKWAGEAIGNPAKIKCYVEYTVNEIAIPVSVTLADLQIQPLDVLHLFGTGPLDGGAELNARISAYVRKNIVLPPDFEGTADDVLINIKYSQRDTVTWSGDDCSFYEKAGLIQSLRELVTNSTPLAADDLLIPGEEEVPDDEIRNIQIDELQVRITNLQARLQIVSDALHDFFTNEISVANAASHTFTNEQIDTLHDLLDQTAPFGIPGSVPQLVATYGNEAGITLLNAADGASKAIDVRLAQAATDITNGKNITLSAEVRTNAFREAARKILGKAFVVLPQFKLRNATDLQQQINLDAAKGLLRNAAPFAMEEWSQGVARVRERLSTLDTVQMWLENFNTFLPEKEPLQFPFALDESGNATDPWLGIEFPSGYAPSEDKLSLVLMNTAAIVSEPDEAKSALLIDEWAEIIPNLNETTGITFNYDQPDAKAPNTLLLAVTPRVTGSWSWDNLVFTLNDTLELSKNRAVEPEQLEDTVFGQILPALLTEIVPPQLLPEGGENSGDAQNNPLGLQVVTDLGVVNDTYIPENEDA